MSGEWRQSHPARPYGVALRTQLVNLLAMSGSSFPQSAPGVAAAPGRRRQRRAWLTRVPLVVLVIVASCRQDAAYDGRTAREWIEQLASPDVRARVRAVDALGRIRPQSRQSVAALARAIQDSSHLVHDAALLSLERAGAPAVPILAETLEDDEPAARAGAASALARIGGPALPALPRLVRALGDSNSAVRAAAATALGALGPSAHDGVSLLLSRTHDPDPTVRLAALHALGRIEERASLVMPRLIAATRDSVADVRYAALQVIQGYGAAGGAALPALVGRLADPEMRVRVMAIDALAALAERARSADSALLRVSRDDSIPSVRARAGSALAVIRGRQLISPREPTAEERCQSGDRSAGRC